MKFYEKQNFKKGLFVYIFYIAEYFNSRGNRRKKKKKKTSAKEFFIKYFIQVRKYQVKVNNIKII